MYDFSIGIILESFKKIVDMEKKINESHGIETLREAKIMGFSDKFIASLISILLP